MKVQESFHLFLFSCHLFQLFASQETRVKKILLIDAPRPTSSSIPTGTPTAIHTAVPTSTPTAAPTLCPMSEKFRADFSSPVPNRGNFKPVKGKLIGKYKSNNVVKLKLEINFGNYRFKKANIQEGDFIDWSVNTLWQDNPGSYGWDNKCRPDRTGLHYDPTKMCSEDSEHIIDPAVSGRRRLEERRLQGTPTIPYCASGEGDVLAQDYKCNPTMKVPKKEMRCEYGDLSGKLGQLEVKKKSKDGTLYVKFKGKDGLFPTFDVLETRPGWSIVLSKNGARFLCAEMVVKCA